MTARALRLAGVAALWLGCGAPQPPPAAPPGPGGAGDASAVATTVRGDLPEAKVYDAKGAALACEKPRADCPPESPDRDFLDRCRLAGYNVRQCGCSSFCAGNVAAKKRHHYDARGQARECAPATPSCSPEPPASAFQDACNEKGFKLVMCECEWLCSGDFSAVR